MTGALATILDYDNSPYPFRKQQSSEQEEPGRSWKLVHIFVEHSCDRSSGLPISGFACV